MQHIDFVIVGSHDTRLCFTGAVWNMAHPIFHHVMAELLRCGFYARIKEQIGRGDSTRRLAKREVIGFHHLHDDALYFRPFMDSA